MLGGGGGGGRETGELHETCKRHIQKWENYFDQFYSAVVGGLDVNTAGQESLLWP